jgi:hypothetical protein
MEANVSTGTQVIPQLQSAFDEFLQLLSALNEDQLNKIPFHGSWTAAQVGDHLLRSYGVAETLKGRTSKTQRPVDTNIPILKNIFLNFETKLQSPEFIIPSEGHINKNDLLQQLKTKTSDIIRTLDSADLTETCLDFDMPRIGFMTKLEWAHFVLYHTQRHINQLKNINRFVNK